MLPASSAGFAFSNASAITVPAELSKAAEIIKPESSFFIRLLSS